MSVFYAKTLKICWRLDAPPSTTPVLAFSLPKPGCASDGTREFQVEFPMRFGRSNDEVLTPTKIFGYAAGNLTHFWEVQGGI